ncbi:MAG TPA: hypothetical protein VI136_20445 [Verrucomicrobiae bacterium]
MNPYAKGVAMVLRLVALALIALGGLNGLLEFARDRVGQGELSVGRCVLSGLLCLAGLILLFGSGALARRLTRDFDE